MCRPAHEGGRRCPSSNGGAKPGSKGSPQVEHEPPDSATPAAEPRILTVQGWRTLTVPVGYLHLDEVKARGWTRDAIAELIDPADVVEVEDAPSGTSPRCYSEAAILAAERAHADRLAAISAADTAAKAETAAARETAQAEMMTKMHGAIPRRETGYSAAECVPTAYLHKRGWTDGHIKRLLGETPDLSVPAGQGRAYLFARERMEQAEATDPALRKRIESHRSKQAAQASDAVESAKAAGEAVFRRRGDVWVLEGHGLAAGDTVTVRRKDGSAAEKHVGALLETRADGTVVALVGKAPAAPRPASPPSTAPDAPSTPTTRARPERKTYTAETGGCPGNPCRCDGVEIWDDCLNRPARAGHRSELGAWGGQYE